MRFPAQHIGREGLGSRHHYFKGAAGNIGDTHNFRAAGSAIYLLGSASCNVQPFAAVSFRTASVSPHVNLADQYNGESLLASGVKSGTEEDLPDQQLRF